MYCYTHRTYYTGHCHHCCHCCGHHVMPLVPLPQYWCGTCQRYTHTFHNHHHWIQPYVHIRPTIICGSQVRDRQTINALAG